MPKNSRKWLGLVLVGFLLVACNLAAPSGSTNPVTPTIAVATATVLAQRTLEPTVSPTMAATVTATPQPPFVGPVINLIVDPSLSKAEYDQEGWPTSVSMPSQGIIFYAVQCGNMDRIKSGFFQPKHPETDQIIISQACRGKSRLLIVSPQGTQFMTNWYGGGMLSLQEEHLVKNGMNFTYQEFEMHGHKLFVSYLTQPTPP